MTLPDEDNRDAPPDARRTRRLIILAGVLAGIILALLITWLGR